MTQGTDHVLEFIARSTWDTMPQPVQHQAKRCLLDALGALIAGTQTPVARIMADFAAQQYQGDEANIIGRKQRVSAVGAALANGFAANGLDIDDGYRRIKGHPGACVLPVLLSAAEQVAPVSGREFLTALVVGYEIGIRAGLLRHALYQTYHSSGSWGAIAGAAAAGRLLKLPADILRQAMGIAEYHAPIAPMMKGIDVPNMGKDSIGWGTMVGMASVLLAQQGFTGVEPIFSDAPQTPNGSNWVMGLGHRYEILNLYFKPYASCRWAQPAIAGALEIARQHQLKAEEIARIRVYTFEAATRLSRAHPKNTEEAQYNLAFPVAAALLDGELGPRQVLPPRLFAPEVLSLADRLETEVKPDYEQKFPEKTYADVQVIMLDGRTFWAREMQAIWEPPDTLPSDAELSRKFQWLTVPLLGQKAATTLMETIWQFDRVDDISEISAIWEQNISCPQDDYVDNLVKSRSVLQ